jgi:uncharacterized protein (TIGR03083 family)
VDVPSHIARLRTEGELMAQAIEAVAPTAPIPTCPEWTMRDLVLHQGEVHRWACAHVAGRRTEPVGDDEDVVGPLPADADLSPWFRDGCAALVDALEQADPALECWTFMKAPSPLAFWARRQCHETAVHRVDAQSASGAITPIPADIAADGVDELLTGFITRSKTRLRSDVPRTIAVRTTDTSDAWLVRVSADPVVTERGSTDAEADCTVSGGASDLELFLWNRFGRETVDVAGDASLLDLWRDTVTIRWS